MDFNDRMVEADRLDGDDATAELTRAIMEFAFDTKRLRVFVTGPFRISLNLPRQRWLFVALPRDDSHIHTPMPVVSILVGDHRFENEFRGDLTIDWLETAQMYRKKGLATEVLSGLTEYVGRRLHASGATEEGRALLRSMGFDHENAVLTAAPGQ